MKYQKILIVLIPEFDPNKGGVQMSTFKLTSYFISQGFDVTIFSFTNKGHKEFEGIKIYHAEHERVNYNQANLDKFKGIVELVTPDIVINQMPYEFNVGSTLKQIQSDIDFLLLGCLRGSFFAIKNNLETYRKALLPTFLQPFFKHRLGYWVLLQFHKWKHGRDLKFIMDTYDYYVLFGDPNRIELEYFIGKYKQDKLAYIPNSIPRVLDSIPQKEKRILWLSRVDYRQKHAELIIPLWKLLKDRLPDWEFDIVGGGGAFDDLVDQVKKEKIERINLYGKQIPDKYYSRSPIYLMTSSFEGFPNTLIEAQSYGCVPVVFNSYPMVEMIIGSSNGLMTPTFDLEAMEEAIIDLVENENRRERMMAEALKNAARFKIENVGEMWIQLFENNINN